MPRKPSDIVKADIINIKRGRVVAKYLGCGYRVLGAGPGITFVSETYPRFPIDMPIELLDRLYAFAVFR